jgi:predicted acylesterase/phospholipase RssA
MNNEKNSSIQSPFLKIALSLSGGGYRAASFHLGTLEMLADLDLLESVKVLSTVSGGTITGAAYSTSLAEGLTVDEFSNKLKSFLKSTNVIAKALESLPNTIQINNFEAMPSLIRAAADIYAAEDFLGNKTFSTVLASGDHLRDISFNATDFRTGNSFRFQKSDSDSVCSGNRYAKVSAEVNEKIRLADIVAASSCFPSGFEPIRFPGDFVWSDNNSLNEIRRTLGENYSEDIPLMDGGVFDNQGIDSLININERVNQEIDLFIVSDTDPRKDKLHKFLPTANKKGMKIKHFEKLIRILQIASLITILAIVIDFIVNLQAGSFNWLRVIFLYLIPFLFASTVIVVASKARSYLTEVINEFNSESGIDLWEYLKNLTLSQAIEFGKSRITSLITMSSSIFMKRIRDLGYGRIYADTDVREKIIANQIYDLNKKMHFKKDWELFISEPEFTPSKELRTSAEQAESYKTNLWFLNSSELDNLIECGRATMCYNILDYLLEKKLEKLANTASPEYDLFQRTKQVWMELNR